MKILSNPRLANVTALAALVIALGGTSYAVTALPKNSVGAKQIQKNAVTSKKVADGSLKAADLNPTDLAALTGVSYTKSASDGRYLRGTITVSKQGSANNGTFGTQIALCPAGYQAIGGGVDPFNVLTEQVTTSGPIVNGATSLSLADGQHPAASGWEGGVVNNSGAARPFTVSVICAPIG